GGTIDMVRLALVIVCTAMFSGALHAQYKVPGGLPSVAPVPVMPAPAVPAIPSPAMPAQPQIAPPPPNAAIETERHGHPPEVCDCYRTIYDQQGRATRIFNGRRHECCP